MHKPLSVLRHPGLLRFPTPSHLEVPEAELFRGLVERYRFDIGSVEVLTATLEARGEARRAREIIEAEGATIGDRFGQVKPHPMVAILKDSRRTFMEGMRALRLDVLELKA